MNRIYEIRNVAVSVPTTDPAGAEWDFGGGAPDLLLEVAVNGAIAEATAAVPDSFSATFAGPFNVQIVAGSTLTLTVYDEDVSKNDLAYACTASPLTADLLRLRDLQCMSAGSSMTFRIAPR